MSDFKVATEAVETVCGYLPSLMMTVRRCCLSASDGNLHIQICACVCVPFVQEGQVLECSLINSIRVGAVPKVRTPAKSHFPPLSVCTSFTHAAHGFAPPQRRLALNESRRTCCIAHCFSQRHLFLQCDVINHADQAVPHCSSPLLGLHLHQHHKRSDPSSIH